MSYAGAQKGHHEMEMDYQKIGLRIQEIRLSKKMTQEELAEAVSCSAIYISSIERGVKIPSVQTIVAIANAMEITSDCLLADVLNNKPSDEASNLQTLLLDCSSKKKSILVKAATSLKEILTDFGI